jgi:hypothetical protein
MIDIGHHIDGPIMKVIVYTLTRDARNKVIGDLKWRFHTPHC